MKQELAKIWVYEIDNREGQLLHNELLNLFNPKGRPRQPEYKLKVKYHETQSDLGISKTEFATRSNLNVSGKFEFTGPNPLSGEARAVVAFNILDSPTGTEFAKRDARKRAIKQVAREIHRRIAVHLLNTPDQTKSEKPIRIIK